MHYLSACLIALSLLLTNCSEKTAVIEYTVLAPEPDTLFVEWLEVGDSDWQSELVPYKYQNNMGVWYGFDLVRISDVDPDDLAAFRPSQVIDSLLVYRYLNGQADSLVHSGINDEEWRLDADADIKYSFSFWPYRN